MINELVKVADAMQNAQINPVDWHPKLKTLPKVTTKSPCIRVWLTNDGHISNIELLPKEKVEQLRKYEPDNGKSLPAFNVRPLYRVVKSKEEINKSARGQSGERIKAEWTKQVLLSDINEQAKNDFWEKTRDITHQCFGRVNDELITLCQNHLHDDETLQIFFNTVKQINIAQFHQEYCNMVCKKVEDGEFSPSLLCYFVTEEKKQKEDNNSKIALPKFSVFLDVKNYNNYPVSHVKTISRLNELLNLTLENKQMSVQGNTDKDAYGLNTQQVNDKFPSVSLSFLGGVILRSQVKAIPAQKRYHQCESATFPVGADTRKRIKAAMEWISSPERNGNTYGVAGNKELLFAYLRSLPDPEKKITITKMFGAQEDSAYEKKDTFEHLSKTVIDQLKGLGKDFANAELEIFSIRKMDKARTKVVYYHNATVESLEKAAASWNKGCQNIPFLDLQAWSEDTLKKTGKHYPITVEALTVFPVKLHAHLNTVWKRDGNEKDKGGQAGKTQIFEPADGLRLLLSQRNNDLSKHMLERFMQHARGYFITLCQSTGKHEISNIQNKEIYPGILGLLLSKLGKYKEDFMNESAFLLGRCLRIADEVHRLYCEVVRKNELPSELCGSSLLVSMMESPVTTLSQLAMRSAPYVKWACAYHDDKAVKKTNDGNTIKYVVLVKSWWRRWADVADQLHAAKWPKRLTPEERAQVFLGYLASFSKTEKPTENNHTDSENSIEQGDKK